MSYPQNPDTIILKNKFYPSGLKEIDVWNYYQKVKPLILKETKNRDLMFIIMTDLNKPIIRRRGKDSSYIRLTPQNYDSVITGRTLSIHSAMGMYEDFGFVDIDIDPRDGFRWAKEATSRTYEYIMDKMPIVKKATIRFTGKHSFHIKCEMAKKMRIEVIKFLLSNFLKESELSKVYTIDKKRRAGVPNLDMAPNKFRGNYITLNALSFFGLKCMEIPYNKLNSFDPGMARIK